MNKGIENLKTTVAFVATAFTTVAQASADGSIGFRDITTLIGLAKQVPGAITAAKDIPAELTDLDENEAADLVQAVADALGHEAITPRTQRIAERALALTPGFVQLWDALQAEETGDV